MNAGDRLLSIGQFARACGLTAKALRHYDAVGLLAPALVEPGSGYRRYHSDQLGQARLIRRLRGLNLPLAEVRPRRRGAARQRAVQSSLDADRTRNAQRGRGR
jgi:DNA-binding transcriptional MerR regulator